jgi:PPOX class probable F420-dependent enzyme
VKKVPQRYQDLLADEKKAFAYLATLMPDGSPQVTPIWFNTKNGYFLINSAKGRIKDRNMRANPEVALAIVDPDDPYRYIQIRGKIIEITQEGADEHIDALAGKYLGKAKYPNRAPGEQRVIYKIEPESVSPKE